MRSLICLVGILFTVAQATPLQKRLGVPLEAEDGCNPNIGNATYVSDADDCQVFYHCDHGWPKLTRCPGETVWTPGTERCEAPEDAVNDDCGYIAPEPIMMAFNETMDMAHARCEFFCVEGSQCIAWSAKCDGVENCDDGSDEELCAEQCDEDNCQLPDCRCFDAGPPGGLAASDTPQMIILTWESAVRAEDYYHLIQQVLNKVTPDRRRELRTNPNGCPFTATFFVNHQFNNYLGVQSLYNQGHEIAVHSISKSLTVDYWKEGDYDTWLDEMAGMRTILELYGNINPDDIIGVRAPYLQVGGEPQFQMMIDEGFVYDMSMPTPQNDQPRFPYTLDFRSTQDCVIIPCPTDSYPGVWVVPLTDWIDTNDTLCALVDNCYFPNDKEESLELLRMNFRRSYDGDRGPVMLNLRSRWFLEGAYNMEALQEFFDEVQALGDVYVVSAAKALEWMRNPTSIADIDGSDVFTCTEPDETAVCEHGNVCAYFNITYHPNSEDHPGDRYMETCSDCPLEYPWLGNPEGELLELPDVQHAPIGK